MAGFVEVVAWVSRRT
jgi:hypothetical protein